MVASKIVLACLAALAIDSVTSVYGIPVKRAELLSGRQSTTIAGVPVPVSDLASGNLVSGAVQAAGSEAGSLPVAGSLISTGLGIAESVAGGAASLAPGGVLQRSIPGVNLEDGNPTFGGTAGNLANSALAEAGGLAGEVTSVTGGLLPGGTTGVTGGLPAVPRRRGESGITVAGVPVGTTLAGLKNTVSEPPVAANTGNADVVTRRGGSEITANGVPVADGGILANPAAGAVSNVPALLTPGGVTGVPNGLPVGSGDVASALAGGLADGSGVVPPATA
jgi:hypothetical protein